MLNRLRWVAWGVLERALERVLGPDHDPFSDYPHTWKDSNA